MLLFSRQNGPVCWCQSALDSTPCRSIRDRNRKRLVQIFTRLLNSYVPINFSALPVGSRTGRILRTFLRLVPREMVVPVLQGRLRGARWIVGSSTHGCWLGTYESPKQHAFAAALRPGDLVVDAGANAGFYTLLAA